MILNIKERPCERCGEMVSRRSLSRVYTKTDKETGKDIDVCSSCLKIEIKEAFVSNSYNAAIFYPEKHDHILEYNQIKEDLLDFNEAEYHQFAETITSILPISNEKCDCGKVAQYVWAPHPDYWADSMKTDYFCKECMGEVLLNYLESKNIEVREFYHTVLGDGFILSRS